LRIWHCNLSADLTKTHPYRPFFGDFAHWALTLNFYLTSSDTVLLNS